jgi:hypothetical protein
VTMLVAARLSVVAAWDVALVRRAVDQLDEVAGRLSAWRARVEGVGRALASGECWTGPAARSAVVALHDLSAVTWAVDTGLARSLEAFGLLAAEADTAQELAGEALAVSAVLPLGTDPGPAGDLARGLPGAPGAAAWDAALRHAAAAAVAAGETGAALAGLGVHDVPAPADFSDLLGHVPQVGPVVPPVVPVRSPPDEAAEWWSALSQAAQLAALASAPGALGALDGVPAWARDRANRLLLDQALADPRLSPREATTARAVAARIAAEEATGRQVQLHLLDLPAGRVALALGDLDTADAVALVVPGIFNTPGDDLDALTADAADLATATRAAAPATSVATMVWLGYRTPSHLGEAVLRTSAERGGPALAAALGGLRAARGAVASPGARTTVVAHSYGTWVVDEAADEPGRLAADGVVLLGSPGMDGVAADLETPAVFDATTPADPISWANWFRSRHTWEEGYGSTGLPVQTSTGHSEYFDPDHPTLAAMGEVVADMRRPE